MLGRRWNFIERHMKLHAVMQFQSEAITAQAWKSQKEYADSRRQSQKDHTNSARTAGSVGQERVRA